jgi:hypothetical protein
VFPQTEFLVITAHTSKSIGTGLSGL